MADLISASEVAILAECHPRTVTTALKTGALRAARDPVTGQAFKDHPALAAWLARPRIRRRGAGTLQTTQRAFAEAEPFNPFAAAASDATLPAQGQSAAPEEPARVAGRVDIAPAPIAGSTKQELYNLQVQAPATLPKDLDELGDLTLRECIDTYGSLAAFRDLTKSFANVADMRNKEGIAAKRRGDLVDRAALDVVFPFLDLATKRIVAEAPEALAAQVRDRVMSGAGGGLADIEEMLHDELSGILKDCVDTIVRELEKIGN